MKSLPTIDEATNNREKYLEVLKSLDPDLYTIKIALEETGVNPDIIRHVIRALGNLTIGAGYGKVQIYMQAKIVTDIEATEKVKINKDGG